MESASDEAADESAPASNGSGGGGAAGAGAIDYHSLFDLSHLKFKERDELIAILTFWKSQPISDNKPSTQAGATAAANKPTLQPTGSGDTKIAPPPAAAAPAPAVSKSSVGGKIGTADAAPESFDIEGLRYVQCSGISIPNCSCSV